MMQRGDLYQGQSCKDFIAIFKHLVHVFKYFGNPILIEKVIPPIMADADADAVV